MRVRSSCVLLACVLGLVACNDTSLVGDGEPPPTDTPSPTPTPVADPIGCADGTREGFLAMDTYPAIAACSGAWSVPGLSQPNLAPTCGRDGGNDSGHPDGNGCSAADLCAEGWHICSGFTEVELNAPSGCADAVPGSAPPGSLFAIAQHSADNMVCDESTADTNDVFGCGNLGHTLSGPSCGPLTAALASEQPGSCGWNEAMPPIGPWECAGSDSYDEGAAVTKNGCPGGSCSYSGNPIGNSDGGGVLCCHD